MKRKMKTTNFIRTATYRLFSAVFATSILFTIGACSSDDDILDNGQFTPGIEFPIYVKATQGAQTEANAQSAKLARSLRVAGVANAEKMQWVPNEVEEILPEGFNPLAAEAEAAEGEAEAKNIMRTQYRYDANVNFLNVVWKTGDQIGIKTTANAQSGSAAWKSLTLTSGSGNKVAEFEGIANTTNGLSPTGSQAITAVYPYSADGSYNLASQTGTIGNLGTYDIRVDNGELTDSYVRDVYLVTKICVLRIAKEFFDNGTDTKTKGYTNATITINGAGIGNQLTGVCSSGEAVTQGTISSTVAIDQYSGKPLEDVYIAFVPIDTDVALFNVEVQCGTAAASYSRYQFYKSHFQTGTMYNLRHPSDDLSEQCIDFKDPKTEAIAIQNFDSDDNGCISYREARAVTYLGQAFQGSSIQYFPELQYFANLKMIPANAFKACSSLEEIVFPLSVTLIGESAFQSCTKLDPELPATITEIERSAFQSCTNLTTVDLPRAIDIGESAFQNCHNLTSVDLPAATTIGNYAFQGCNITTLDLPQATTIGQSAFSGCASLTSVDLPEATTIGQSAFFACDRLISVDLPVATTIEYNTFRDCYCLVSVNLPEATTIEESAFCECTSLTTVDLPKATTIGYGAFTSCTSLTTVDLPQATTIGDDAFSGCTSLTTVDLPQVTTIGGGAFRECTSLTSVDLPMAITFGAQVFLECGVTSLSLPAATRIEHTIYYDGPLTTLHLPKCTYIGREAFATPGTLISVTVKTGCVIDSYAFWGYNPTITYVP